MRNWLASLPHRTFMPRAMLTPLLMRWATPLTLLAPAILMLGGFVAMVVLESLGAVECGRTSQLQLQFAWTQARMEAILGCWGEPGRAAVLRGLVADFVFIVGYAALLAVLSLRAGAALAVRGFPRWSEAGRFSVLAIIGAGFLDVVENLLVWAAIRGATEDPLAAAIGLLAGVKFVLAAGSVVFVASAGWVRLRSVRGGCSGSGNA